MWKPVVSVSMSMPAVSVSMSMMLVALLAVQAQDELNRDRPCEHPNAISLPSDKKCIVPIKTAYTWSNAAATCERALGSLYKPPDSQLGSRPELMRCLASMTDPRYNAMWINAFGVWSPHFTWTNGTSVNSVDYCSTMVPPRQDNNNITSDTLSVDYCVYTCQDKGAKYTVYFNNSRTLECYCSFVLKEAFTNSPCTLRSVSVSRLDTYFILQKKDESLIQINTDGNVVSRTEILCATVDSTTSTTRKITSEMCFNSQNFICDLGDANKCTYLNCTTQECRVTVRSRCLLRVGLSYNWYAARAYCQTRGGDLWNLYALNDLKEITLQDSRVTKYWVGATNYDWKFDSNSASLGSVPSTDYNRVRCGNMVRDSSTGLGLSWQWSDTICDQQKAFLCQFDKNEFSAQELALTVSCPWVQISYPPDLVTTPGNNGGSGSNGGVPVVTQPQGGSTGSSSGDSFPWEAVIASIVAGLVLLTCLGLTLAYCSRRQWLASRFKKVREHLTFIPYFADVSGTDYDSHVNISSVSDHGSQVGLVKGGYHNTSGYNMSTSYGEQSGAFSSKSLDRRGKETLERKSAEGQSYGSGNTSLDERGYTATYNTLPAKPRDLMTLQAHMDIKDDAELASLRASFRNKPEVALVTDNVDMNFTVNHVVPRANSQPNGDLSRSALEKTIEEISLPAGDAGLGLNLPERVAEEARMYSTMTSGYH